jgi:hypothetical protein
MRTTTEHPFWVENRCSWLAARELAVGDQLRRRDGPRERVAGAADSGEETPVYNWRIAEYHTYYISVPEEGNSLWAHNMCDELEGESAGRQLFENQLPDRLAAELDRAAELGVEPIRPGTSEFDAILAEGTGKVKWVVPEDEDLSVIVHEINGEEIPHTVASGGRPVLGAGEADVAGDLNGYFGLEISPHSGHYLNGASAAESARSLQIGRRAFERLGIVFPS